MMGTSHLRGTGTAARLRAVAGRLLPALFLALSAASLAPAHGTTIIQAKGFSFSGPNGIVGFDEFDPALGALDTVNVSITGTLNFSFQIPQGSAVQPQFSLDMTGIGGRGWNFSGSGARLVFPAVDNPNLAPIVTSLAAFFSFDFTLTALTDLTGVVVPNASASGAALLPPVITNAQRDDFVEQLVSIGILETFSVLPVGFTPVTWNTGGAIILTYDYTPAEPAPTDPVAVPAPTAAPLLALGLWVVWRARRRKSG